MLLEPHPGRQIMDEGEAPTDESPGPARTRYLIRVTHSSGMLEGKYTKDTVFPPTDHRSHRPKSWLINGLKKIETLQFLVGPDRTLGQAALAVVAGGRARRLLPAEYLRGGATQVNSQTAPESPAADEGRARPRRRALCQLTLASKVKCRTYKGTMTREPAAV